MAHQQSPSCCSGNNSKIIYEYIDPVCGMQVAETSEHYFDYQDIRYLFCSVGCQQKFSVHPENYLNVDKAEQNASSCCSEEKQQKQSSCCDTQKEELTVTETSSCCAPKPDASKASTCCDYETQPQPTKPEVNKSACCGGGHAHQVTDGETEIDPVCGMSVKTTTDLKIDYHGKTYYFCNPSCLEKFKNDPEFYLIPVDQRPLPEGAMDMDYTCPMDPEIVQKGPGTCPICGMALEPMQPTLDEGPNPELVDFSKRFWATLPLSLLVVVLAMGSHIHAFISPHIQPWIELILSLPVVLWAGYPILQRCWVSYKTRHLNMWSLIGVGVLAAFIYSVVATIFPSLIPVEAKTGHGVAVYYEAACMIVSLSLLGQVLELKARSQTANSLKALLRLQPSKAKLVQDDQVVDVDIAMIKQGDVLQIASGEQIPLDGVVIEGKTYVDESMMTGEPVPVKKEKDDQVIGGTINQQGSIRIQTTAVGTNTTLAKMIQTVADAQRSKAPLQRIADVVAKYFVMVVLAISVLTFIAWMVFGKAQFDLALMCAVAVLIIACPCALGLATPMSVMATTGRAAQKGVLFKDAEAIEALSKVNTLIIDKTGTLTEGKPSLKKIQPLSKTYTQAQIELWIASIEQYSTHPIAQTLTKLVEPTQLLNVIDFEDVTGFGVRGQIDGKTLYIGSQKLVDQLGLTFSESLTKQLDQMRSQGDVISFLMSEQEVIAYVSIHDAIKQNAKAVIDQLHADGIDVIMATGDHEKNAQMVAEQLGINQVYGNCDPKQKLEIVKQAQAQGKVVVMAGDGINDAPALAQANVGIAMGTGTDIAKQTAQVTLVKGDIQGVAHAVHMAKLGVKNMKQNLAFSFIYNGLGVPVAAGLFYPLTGLLLTPMFAAVAMSLSSLSVVVNALRLNRS
ncbi:heavy metal translocating P-type ATPase [Acinetobacter haemolyticus]|uniref:heavy metal translocating P-type ATPase n=1 Tax=Acinetobacter haemolyticus TaxID=29430 RepID=UPI0013724908|nr:heavy metal translocating P-type ATPase [Acinetobacter haemolyticus]NAR59227.1 cadmium-translocating P-type ATPase [Acinetobacter haemolyticus]NAR68792.1 cadmium-translocating P-type ATPase [Acinetobacter haemolyticus]NAR91276.1 cadmium-translocating P-type ATPase [Acinetobacter haemolyticus]